jgi:hypothetical protein
MVESVIRSSRAITSPSDSAGTSSSWRSIS